MKNIYTIFKSAFRTGAAPVAFAALLVFGHSASAQVIKTFTQRTSSYTPEKKIYNIKGDFTMIGNTNLKLGPGIDLGENNSNQMVYVDVDSDPNTWNSSSANLTFSNENGAVPSCSNIIYAGLYWTGRAHDGSSPNIFTVSKDISVPQTVNQIFSVSNGQSINYSTYSVSVTRQGTNNNYFVRYTFSSTGNPTVDFEFENTPNIRYRVNGGTWTSATGQNIPAAVNNLRTATFDPVTVYSATGGIILTVNKLVRDSRTTRNESQYQSNATATGNVSGTYYTTETVTKTYDKHIVSFKGPGATSYNTITANASDIYYPTNSEGSMYSAYAEVTDYVKTHGLGDYFVADVAISEGDGGGTGFYGGWGMIVVYENSKMKNRDVTIFDGHAYVQGSTTISHELPVVGFNTIQAGNVNMKLGLMAGEGDLSISGDYFKIQQLQTANWIALNHSGNTTGNFFNSSVNTGANTRNPNITNNTGLDIAMFNIPNSANSVIGNNQTSTKFQYGSTQDTYIIFCIAMAVDAYKPAVEGLVSVKEIKRNGLTVSNSGTVLPGDVITYKIDIKNKGSEAVNNAKFIIPIPYTGGYVDGSAVKHVYFTPLPSPNALSFDPTGANGSVIYNLGALPLDADPNKILADLEFNVKVTEDCSILKACTSTICINGVISGTGSITGTSFNNAGLITGFQNQAGSCDLEPIPAPLCLNINGTSYVNEHCGATPDIRAFTYCNAGSSIPITQVSNNFPSGSRFFNTYPVTSGSTEYTISNPFPSTSGTITYYAVPPGTTDCYFQFTITNTNISSVPTASPVSYCQDDVAVQLTATPSNPAYMLYYYTSGSPLETPQVSITPSTVTPGVTTYYVAEGISGQCISPSRAPIVVTVNALPTVGITNNTGTTVLTCNTKSISVTATGGVSYSWTGGATPAAAANSFALAGNYTVTVTNANGCTKTASILITEAPSVIVFTATATQPKCFGEKGIVVLDTPTGGTAPYILDAANPALTGLAAGSYTYKVKDANGCEASVTKSINQSATAITATITDHTNVNCFGDKTGDATVTAEGGTAGYSYLWNTIPVQTSAKATGLAAGIYTVTVSDENGCTQTAEVTITQPEAGLSITTTQINVACYGESTGSATGTVTGGTGPYSWDLSPVQTTPTAVVSDLAAGYYWAVVTDANGCSKLGSVTITQPSAALTASVIEHTNVLCHGDPTGAAYLSVTGGTEPYTYLWSNAANTKDITGLAAGTYNVTITDKNNCTTTAEVTITQPETALVVTTTQVNVACAGGSTGSATASASGGTGIYTYSWNTSPVQNSATATALTTGTYTVTAVDANGCTNSASSTIVVGDAPTVSAGPDVTINCTTPSTTLGASGGTFYSWSPVTGLSDPLIPNPVASPSVTTTYTVTVSVPSGELVSNGNFEDGNTGGFTSAYGYVNTPYNTTPSSGLYPEGKYAVTSNPNTYHPNFHGTGHGGSGNFMAVNGATTAAAKLWGRVVNVIPNTKYFFSTWISSINPDNLARLSFSINGSPIGNVITAPAMNGQANPWSQFYAEWTSGSGITTADIQIVNQNIIASGNDFGLDDISFTTVCSNSDDVLITVDKGVTAAIINNSETTILTCTTPAISVTATGGSSYSWSNGSTVVGTTANLSITAPGTFTVTVTAANGCTDTKSITITEDKDVKAGIINNSGTSVLTCNITTISLTATGGVSYSWSDGSTVIGTAADLSVTVTGTYTVTATAANGCTDTESITITKSDLLIASISEYMNVSCNGGTSGWAQASVSGGKSPYTYSWNTSPVQTMATATGLAAGTYTVTVTDANGCTAKDTRVITAPEAITLSATHTNATCNGKADGTISATSNGTVVIKDANGNTVSATGLGAGTYTLTASSINSNESGYCSAEPITVTITEPEAISVSGIANNVKCYGESNGSISVTHSAGATVVITNAANQVVQSTGLPAGVYTLTATASGENSQQSCTKTATVTISQPAFAVSVSGVVTNVSCFGGSNGSINVSHSAGSTVKITNSANQLVSSAGLPAGVYTLTATAPGGNAGQICTAMAVVTITQPAALNASITAQANVLCFGSGATGSVTVLGSNGTAPYSYNLNGSTYRASGTFTSLAPGSYTVTVKDANGCTVNKTVSITQPAVLTASITAKTNVKCYGGTTGEATVSTTGGNGPYSFSWNTTPVQTSAKATALSAGTYTVTVKDANLCTTTASVTITQPAAVLSASITARTNVLCSGGSTGSATAAVTGGTAAYAYSWNTSPVQLTATATNIAAGNYTVTVTDANSCSTTADVTITQPATILSVATTAVNVACTGETSGSATATATGGTGEYSYSWNTDPVQTKATATGLAAGIYTVTVADANGCSKTASVTVNESGVPLSLKTTPKAVTCKGNSDGSINLEVSGGTSPFKYSWTGSGTFTATTEDLVGVAGGTYNVTVTDNYGCMKTSTATVNESAILMSLVANQVAVTCKGSSTGSVNLTVTGGTAPYTYVWTGPGAFTASTEDLTGIAAGIYNVTVTEANGCAKTTSVNVIESGSILSLVATPVAVGCAGSANGSINLAVTGGTAPFTYAWTGPNNFKSGSANIANLSGGIYNLTVTDNYGCVKTTSAAVNESQSVLSLVATAKDATRKESLDGTTTLEVIGGSINLEVNGGTAPFTYKWTGPGTFTANTEDIDNLSAGTYSVTVTDANGCVKTISSTVNVQVVLAADETCDIFVPNVFTPNADGVHDYFEIKCLYNYENAEIQIYNRNGNLLFQKDHYGNLDYWGSKERAYWNGRSENKLNFMGSELPVGTYYYILKLGNGKVLTGFIFLGR